MFGWTKKNEISNGRWVMFGLMVGMLTEYATGVSFIDQLKMIVSFLGIADIYDVRVAAGVAAAACPPSTPQ